MTWILLFWFAGSDSGFPSPSQGFVKTEYASQQECFDAGKAFKIEGYHHLVAWYCAPGALPDLAHQEAQPK